MDIITSNHFSICLKRVNRKADNSHQVLQTAVALITEQGNAPSGNLSSAYSEKHEHIEQYIGEYIIDR
ncbi:hypothetical protein T11_12834 [Trichinella zimbabwensis]|uniref:Uncharacterized protein n=1 Tax=Trichinella zimbabwensis TaxID=268475 RepID=A0A0V1HIR4_9BILA|nr:hypothetical protein T11_12834 [Trichinella zimbabwensis]